MISIKPRFDVVKAALCSQGGAGEDDAFLALVEIFFHHKTNMQRRDVDTQQVGSAARADRIDRIAVRRLGELLQLFVQVSQKLPMCIERAAVIVQVGQLVLLVSGQGLGQMRDFVCHHQKKFTKAFPGGLHIDKTA